MDDMHRVDPHPDHDPLDLAVLLDGDPEPSDRAALIRATERITACTACAAIHADLVALAVATRALPAPAMRTRDFRLTAADAARLRPAGWRRILAAFGGRRDALTRPLALGLTTIGFAGLLIGAIPGAMPLGGASAPAAPAASNEQAEAMGPASTFAGGDRESVVDETKVRTDGAGDTSARSDGPSPMTIIWTAMLAGGLGLYVAKRTYGRGAGNRLR